MVHRSVVTALESSRDAEEEAIPEVPGPLPPTTRADKARLASLELGRKLISRLQ